MTIIDLEKYWWEREIEKIRLQAEEVETAMSQVLDSDDVCEYDPKVLKMVVGCSNWRKVDNKATWVPFILYFDGKPVFTMNAACDRKQGASIINCSRKIRNKMEMFYCRDITEIVSAAKRYATEQILTQLEFCEDEEET